ncbi:MAG: cytochrome P450 [Chthoniobacterales bacterium]
MSALHRSVSLDPRDASFVQDPYPFYTKWRTGCPVFHWKQLGHWCFAAYDDVSALLRDRRFGRQILHLATREELGWPEVPEHLVPFYRFEEHSLLEVEPPVHTRLRGFINPSFLPRQIERLRPEIENLAHQLIDQFASRNSTDLITSFAEPVPVMVIASFLGVPTNMAPQILSWSHDMVAMYQARRDRAVEDRAVTATIAFSTYMRGLLAQRHAEPGGDFLSQLLTARDNDGTTLTEDELVTTAILLLNAGHEATVHSLGNGVQALLRHGKTSDFLADPARCSEEMLRFDTPLHMFKRYALQDLEYRGLPLRKGDQIGLLLASANRDEQKFPSAPDFLPARQPNPHVSFGAGLHFCLGAPLARLEMQTALRVLFERLPHLRLDSPARYRDTWHFHALESLPVRWP